MSPQPAALCLLLAALVVACGESSGDSGAPDAASGGGGTGGSAGSIASGGSLASGGQGGTAGASPSGGSGGAAERIWGVTIDGIDPLSDITTALGMHAKKPTTRIVFDEFMPATDYQAATAAIHAKSFVMGEILDSFYVAEYTPADYVSRAQEYVSLLAPVVDIWEIGNEINGEWLCAPNASSCTAAETADVVQKIDGAYDVVKNAGGKTALTLYYNQDCWSSPDNEAFTWAAKNVPEKLVQGLDYVLVSYYEDDCNGLQPNWPDVFTKLAAMFPNSKLGIGECGTTDDAKKAEYVTRYYTASVPEPRFIGGDFWWYYRQDMVPYTNSLWGVLDAIMSAP